MTEVEQLRADARALREVLLRVAPHVAVHARNPLVSPGGRTDLLSIEPDMLKVLLATKYLEGKGEQR